MQPASDEVKEIVAMKLLLAEACIRSGWCNALTLEDLNSVATALWRFGVHKIQVDATETK